jgi:hypothetical protein
MSDEHKEQKERKRWFLDGIEYIEPNPLADDPDHSYGVQEPTYDYDDKLYTLTYDAEISKLLINRIIVKGFQIENPDVEQVFKDVFAKLKEANLYKTRFDHDYATETEVEVKADQAHVIINNIKLPKPLRNLMFNSSGVGKTLHVQTVITKRLARKKHLNTKSIDDFLFEILKKNPENRVPKTY